MQQKLKRLFVLGSVRRMSMSSVGDFQIHRKEAPVGEPCMMQFDRICVANPFSCFSYLDECLHDYTEAVHRCFSLARMSNAETIIKEDIRASGILLESLVEIKRFNPTASVGRNPIRFSFWRRKMPVGGDAHTFIGTLKDSDCVGYMILHEVGTFFRRRHWIVFEAVIRPHEGSRWIVPNQGDYGFCVAGTEFTIRGNLYCQQNGISTVCAHVALRSILSAISPNHDVSYADINRYAKEKGSLKLRKRGLTIAQIEHVVHRFKLSYDAFFFDPIDDDDYVKEHYTTLPYGRIVHAGVESGQGTLLGFKLDIGSSLQHIVPVFGHTFDGFLWNKEAEDLYFKNYATAREVTTGNCWTDMFVAHDDNVGPNVTISQEFVRPIYVTYVMNVLKPGYMVSGVEIESCAWTILSELFAGRTSIKALSKGNVWRERLCEALSTQKHHVALRAVSLTSEEYLTHLRALKDWAGNNEPKGVVDKINFLPNKLWVVEVSLQPLFPANQRKIGELVIAAGNSLPVTNPEQNDEMALLFSVFRKVIGLFRKNDSDRNRCGSNAGVDSSEEVTPEKPNFVLLRLPGIYLVPLVIVKGQLKYLIKSSSLMSHTECWKNLDVNAVKSC